MFHPMFLNHWTLSDRRILLLYYGQTWSSRATIRCITMHIPMMTILWMGFLWVLRFPPPIKLIATINNITEITESGVEPYNP
jgi:hypothetical protein